MSCGAVIEIAHNDKSLSVRFVEGLSEAVEIRRCDALWNRDTFSLKGRGFSEVNISRNQRLLGTPVHRAIGSQRYFCAGKFDGVGAYAHNGNSEVADLGPRNGSR
jgi:hypothetical protein